MASKSTKWVIAISTVAVIGYLFFRSVARCDVYHCGHCDEIFYDNTSRNAHMIEVHGCTEVVSEWGYGVWVEENPKCPDGYEYHFTAGCS